jgi:hypothetical protein
MDFFTELEPWLAEGTTLTPITADQILAGERDLADFDTVVAVDGALLPGYTEQQAGQGLLDLPPTAYDAEDAAAIGQALRAFAESGGNVVLTDDALQGLAWMGVTGPEAIGRRTAYAGHAVFGGDYSHPLATGVHTPGAATGTGGRKQVVEPLPIGYSINGNHLPQFTVATSAVTAAGGTVAATTQGAATGASVAEIPVGTGRVVTLGSLLPFPTTAFYHPFGLSSYGLTDIGFTLFDNAATWQNPAQNAAPALGGTFDGWVASDTPTRIYVDGSQDLPVR